MDIEQARKKVMAAWGGWGKYTLDDYKLLVSELFELLECAREEIDTSLVDTGGLCITGLKVLTILEPKGSHDRVE